MKTTSKVEMKDIMIKTRNLIYELSSRGHDINLFLFIK